MKTLAKLSLAAALLGAPLSANALAQIFAGADGVYSDTTLRSGPFGKNSDKIMGYGVRGGVYLGDSKLYLGYYYEPKAELKVSNGDYTWDAKKIVLGWDWGVIGAFGFKLVVGVNVGRADTKETYAFSDGRKEDFSNSGWLAGIKAGVKYEFLKFNEIEFGVKREWGWYGDISKPELTGGALNFSNKDNTRQESTSLYLGYIFKFGI